MFGAGLGSRQIRSTLVGEQNGGQFSWGQPAVSETFLWASEPLFGLIRSEVAALETGRVLGYRLGSGFPGNGTVAVPASEPASVCIIGDAAKGRFGATMAAIAGSSLVAVAAPQSYLQARLSGTVYLLPQ